MIDCDPEETLSQSTISPFDLESIQGKQPRGKFETQKSGNKTNSGEIGLDI